MKMATDLEKLTKYLNAMGLTAKCKVHGSRKTFKKLKAPSLMKLLEEACPNQQVIVKGKWGEISVIRGNISLGDWEIYCLEGELFSGIRRYKTMTDCARTIYGLLTEKKFDAKIPRQWDAWTDLLTNDLEKDETTQEVVFEREKDE